MTRKRFTKMVMGLGYDRNKATIIASYRPADASHDEYFRDNQLSLYLGAFGISTRKAAKAFRKLGLATANVFASHDDGGTI